MNINLTHNRRRTTIFTVAFILLAASVVALLSYGKEASASPSGTLTLVQRDINNKFVDVPPRGGEEKLPTPGDKYVIYNALLDASGKTIGHGHAVCDVTIGGKRAAAICRGALVLADGTLFVETYFPFSGTTQSGAVIGGDGVYAGARGTTSWSDSNGANSAWKINFSG